MQSGPSGGNNTVLFPFFKCSPHHDASFPGILSTEIRRNFKSGSFKKKSASAGRDRRRPGRFDISGDGVRDHVRHDDEDRGRDRSDDEDRGRDRSDDDAAAEAEEPVCSSKAGAAGNTRGCCSRPESCSRWLSRGWNTRWWTPRRPECCTPESHTRRSALPAECSGKFPQD